MQPTMKREIVIKALLMPVWRRQPNSSVIVHSDQGSQYTSEDYQAFLMANNLTSSMRMLLLRVSSTHLKQNE